MILVTGGCRSGKSGYAQRVAEALAPNRLYVATAEACDKAMRERIERHQQARDASWHTLELPMGFGLGRQGVSPVERGGASCNKTKTRRNDLLANDASTLFTTRNFDLFFAGYGEQGRVVLVDCLTLWVSGLMVCGAKERQVRGLATALLASLRSLACPVVVVTNEVGLGGITATRQGREFCDVAGMVNQLAASEAETVVLVVSGLPMTIKGMVP